MSKRFSSTALLCLTYCLSAQAQVTIPNVFVSGTPATASTVNANFSALSAAINSLANRVSKIEGKTALVAADVAGTYTLTILSSEFAKSSQTDVKLREIHLATYIRNAIVSLNSDGTASLSQTNQGWQSKFQPGRVTGSTSLMVEPTFELVPFETHSSNPNVTNLSGTWIFNNNREVAVTFGGDTLTFTGTAPGIAVGSFVKTFTEPGTLALPDERLTDATTSLFIAIRKP